MKTNAGFLKCMVRCLVMLALVLTAAYTYAQPNITKVEYFIDTDPGFDQAINIPITQSPNIANQLHNVNLATVANGLHNLFLRSKDANGKWSVTNRVTFYRTNLGGAGLPNITKAEYFIDTDPGFGNAISIPVTASTNIADRSVSVNLSAVPDGLHNFYLRTQDANGHWSISNRATFYRANFNGSTLPNITKAEYFIDTDPGFGAAIPITISAGTNIADRSVSINLSAVSEGLHNLYIRSQDANGKWSVSNRATFYRANLNSATLPNITKAEYFIDTDPGFGAAVPIAITAGSNIADKSVSINLSAVSEGLHNLYLRTQDANGKWSVSNRATFYRANINSASLPNITRAEYFIDTDPGFGGGVPISISASSNIADQSVNVNLAAVGAGLHNLYIRTQDANGKWSVSNRATFFILGTEAALPNIVKAEYFVDTDPGFGLANNIPVTPGTNLAEIAVSVDISTLLVGKHFLFIRSIDANGKWSITNLGSFIKPAATDLIISLGLITPNSLCAGGTIQIPFTINAAYNAGNMYTAQLSNASGNFDAPVTIGTLSGTGAGTISATVPANTAAGSNYRVRVLSNNPADISDTSIAITINRIPSAAFSIAGKSSVCLTSETYNISSPAANTTYTWSLPSGGSFSPSTGNSTVVNWTTAGSHILTATASNACGTGNSATLNITALSGAPAIIPGITQNNRSLTASALTGGATAYQWYKDNVLINGATNQTFVVPNLEFGQYSVAYTNSCGTGAASAAVMVAIAKTSQTITFTAVPAKTFGDAAFNVVATASSNLAISSYSIVSGPGTISGNTVTITGAGTIVVKATQDGNATFNTAENTLNIPVAKAAATVVLSNLTSTYDGTAKQAIATTNPLGLNVALTYNGSSAAPVNGGTYTVVANITSANYQGSSTAALIIGKTTQTISLANPGTKNFNDVPFAVTALASSGLPVSFALQTVPASGVASINGNLITLLGAGGTVTINATQAGDNNYNAAALASTSFEVRPPTAKDVQVISLVTPTNGCELGVTAPITIRIRNTGTQAATGFPVSYRINNETAVTESFSGSIAPGSNADFTFATKGIFAQTGITYQLTLYTALAGDEKTNNDTLPASVVRFAPAVITISKDTAICAGAPVTLRTFGAGTTVWTNGPTSSAFTVSPATTTTYTATVTDANNCKNSTLNVTVTVNPNPVVNAGTDQSILRGSSATLQATGALTYLWNNGVNTASNVVSPTATTTYTVTGTNDKGCSATDDVRVTVNFSAITVSNGLLQFDGVVADSTKTLFVTVTNTGTITETINSITGLSLPFTTTLTAPVSLPAGTSVQIPVTFAPTATLIYQNTMALATSAGNFNIVLRGTGTTPAPSWTITPSSYNFGKVERNTNVTHNLVIKNTGNIAIRISSISSSSPRFTGTTNGILNIPVGGTVNLAVRFNPIAVTSYSGTITVRTSTVGLPLLRPIVAGNGVIPGNPPALEFVSRPPFDGDGGVTPGVGKAGSYTYSVLYKHPNGIAPMANFPQVGIDKNNDRDFADAQEGLFTMTKEGNGTNWAAGEVYSFTTDLTVSELYGYQFFATDANGNDALITEYKKGPVVTREVLDLHIFASDIKFSKANPAVNEDFTVTATINNNSPYSVADVPLRFYYKDSLFLFNDTIPFIDGKTTVSVTHTLNFSPDGFYPIKVWIDTANTLKEGNLLNNYASRPVIVGDFTVPGTIDLVSNATPSGCSRGKVTYSGRANYRGLNLAGTPPVEGAEVTIHTAFGDIKTTTDIYGNWNFYHDPCAGDSDPDCQGYICGVTYNYSVEVTDFTLTSPVLSGTVTRPCVPCTRTANLQQFASTDLCVLENKPFTITTSIANFEVDFNTGKPICAPIVYNDTITMFVDGQLAATYIEDSIVPCGSKSYQYLQAGLPLGQHNISLNHIYYFANGERVEKSGVFQFTVQRNLPDLEWGEVSKTGATSFIVGEGNKSLCVVAGAHLIYLYDSLPGYTEKVLIDSLQVPGLSTLEVAYIRYNNPLWEPGCHYLTAIADAKLQVDELFETNNKYEFTFCVSKPDIVFGEKGELGNIKASSSSTAAGGSINFSVPVKNIGTPVRNPFKVQFRANGALLGSPISIPSLGTNESVTIVSAPFAVPVSLCPVEITTKADIDEVIDEEVEKNNFDTIQYGININAGRSCDDEDDNLGAGFFSDDDVIGTINCSPYVAPKGVLSYLATTVRNKGTRDAKNVKVQFKLNGTVLGTDVIPLLKAGQSTESGFYYAFDTVGRFIVNAFADYTREICEIDEKDNIGNIHVDVPRTAADLEVLSQYIAPSNLNPLPGQTIAIVSSVVNKGDAPAGPSKIRFWINDVQLGDDIPIDSLFPGMDTTVMATMTYSSNIVGPKIVKVTADIDREVLDRRRTNNEATRAIIVGGAPDFARAKSEAITLSPSSFIIGDTISIRHYIRNYGGDGGASWVRFYYRNAAGEKILIDSLRLGLESNDSARISLKWKVAEAVGQIITEIVGSIPPEFNDLNNIDSLRFEVALPLTLLQFNGAVKNENAILNWRTSNEDNVKQFEIERSINGSRFDKVATVKALNTAGLHNYEHTDSAFNTLPAENIYYRLRMVDIDGQFSYSNIVRLNKKPLANYVKIYPNPVKQTLMVQIQSTSSGNYTLRIMDGAGKLVMAKQFGVSAGKQTLSMPVQMLPQGMYMLVMQQPDGSSKEVKFIKE